MTMTDEQTEQARPLTRIEERNHLRFHRKRELIKKAAFYSTLGIMQMFAALYFFPGNSEARVIGSIPLIFAFVCALLSGYYSWRMTETVEERRLNRVQE